MKKIISMLLLFSAVLSLSACGVTVNIDTGKNNDKDEPKISEKFSEKIEKTIDKVEDTVLPAVGLSPEFKEMMDSYEAFFDEYCEFIKKFNSSTDQMSLFADYSDFMMKYTEYMTKLDDVGKSEMSDAEMMYYTEVNLRIQKKLLEAPAPGLLRSILPPWSAAIYPERPAHPAE